MIGCTKLLCGMATVSEALKMHGRKDHIPSHMLQFSAVQRPLVVWNMTHQCNLRCKHCYINADENTKNKELSTKEAEYFIDDLAQMKVPVLLLSGGEPLLRDDIFHLGRFATDRGLRVILSTNGTLISPAIAEAIKKAGIQYVGVSMDGLMAEHDDFRGVPGSFQEAIQGIRNAARIGLKTGIRFTIHKDNESALPGILDIVENEAIPRFCMYHLVYSGRGRDIMKKDCSLEAKRKTMDLLIKKTMEFNEKGIKTELLTVDNHADGAYIHHYLKNHDPKRASEVMDLLKMHGGCSAGTKFSNVDPLGNVHPCQFWQHVDLGNVKERKFSEIWNDPDNTFLEGMRNKQKNLKGRCGKCNYNEVCGGCRIRAEAVHGDLWGEDPACYLTDEEIGLLPSEEK